MLIAVFIAMILLLLWPLLAEVRMVIRAILYGSVGTKAGQQLLKEMPFLPRLTLHGVAPHVKALARPYRQYMRLQLMLLLAAAGCIALVVLLVNLRQAVPALILCILFDITAFAGISVIHAHAGYDPDKRTTRYNRNEK